MNNKLSLVQFEASVNSFVLLRLLTFQVGSCAGGAGCRAAEASCSGSTKCSWPHHRTSVDIVAVDETSGPAWAWPETYTQNSPTNRDVRAQSRSPSGVSPS